MISRIEKNDDLLLWAAPRIGLHPEEMARDMITMGVRREEGGELLAVIGYNAFYAHYCMMHVITERRRDWATRDVLRDAFGFPFGYMKLKRVNAVIPSANRDAQVLALKLGFSFNGYMPKGSDDETDAILFGMTADSCPWFKEVSDNG